MERIRLLIKTADRGYGEALGTALAKKQHRFKVTVLTMECDVPFEREYDMLLIDETVLASLKTEHTSNPLLMIVLTEDSGRCSFRKEGKAEGRSEESSTDEEVVDTVKEDMIFLYQFSGVEVIAKALWFYHGKVNANLLDSHKFNETKIAGFYSASGGVGKTSIAIGTGRELSRYGRRRVLYVNFEEVESTEAYLEYSEGFRSVNTYLYYLFMDHRRDLSGLLETFTAHDEYGMGYFNPGRGRNGVKSLSLEETGKLIETLCESNLYDYILLDMEGDTSEQTGYLLSCCHKVFLIQDDSQRAKVKNVKAMDYLEYFYGQEISEKFCTVANKMKSNEDQVGNGEEQSILQYDQSLASRGSIQIFYDPASFTVKGKRTDIDIHHGFGLGVKRIAESMDT